MRSLRNLPLLPAPTADAARTAVRLACLIAAFLAVACDPEDGGMKLRSGIASHRALAVLTLPLELGEHAITVDMAGGNLLVYEPLLSTDTNLEKNQRAFRTWNSSLLSWHRNDELFWNGTLFVNETRAGFLADALPREWSVSSCPDHPQDRVLRRHDGLLYHFSTESGDLRQRHPAGNTHLYQDYDDGQVQEHLWELGYLGQVEFESHDVFQWSSDGVMDRAGWGAAFDDEYTYLATNYDEILHTYDEEGRLATIAYPELLTIHFTYTDSGRIESIRQGNLVWNFSFPGLSANVSGPNGFSLQYAFQEDGQVSEITHADGTTSAYTWQGFHPVTRTTPSGTVLWSYPSPSAVEFTSLTGNTTVTAYADDQYTLDGSRPVLEIHDDFGQIRRVDYGPPGAVFQRAVYDAFDEVVLEVQHDIYGRTLWRRDARDNVVTYDDFGPHGNAEAPHYGERSELVNPANTVDERVYDPNGNLMEGALVSQPGVSRVEHRADRLAEVVYTRAIRHDPFVHVTMDPEEGTSISRRFDGRPVGIYRPMGANTVFTYCGHGHPLSRKDWDGSVWQTTLYPHTEDLSVQGVWKPNGMQESHHFDAAGRRTQTEYSRDAAPVKQVAYGYSAATERLEWASDTVSGLTNYGYDTAGRLSHTIQGNTTHIQVWDGRDRLSQSIYQLGGAVVADITRSYDAADRVVAWHDRGQLVMERFYRTDGQIEKDVHPDGSEDVYVYGSNAGRLLYESPAGRTWYGADAIGHYECEMGEVGICQTHSPPVSGPEWQHYVLAPRTVGAGISSNRAGPRLVVDGSRDWEYDSLNNAYQVGGNFVYDRVGSRLLEAHGLAYTYDEAGYTLSRGADTFEYDADGLPTKAGSWTAAYDARGHLMTFGGLAVAFQGRLVGAILTDGEATVNLATDATTVTRYDFRGAVVGPHGYSGYGTDASPSTGEQSFAQGFSLPQGLVLLGARILDTDTGRFLSPDPVYQLLNQYQYAGGNPVHWWDPDGRQASGAGKALGRLLTGPAGVAYGTVLTIKGALDGLHTAGHVWFDAATAEPGGLAMGKQALGMTMSSESSNGTYLRPGAVTRWRGGPERYPSDFDFDFGVPAVSSCNEALGYFSSVPPAIPAPMVLRGLTLLGLFLRRRRNQWATGGVIALLLALWL